MSFLIAGSSPGDRVAASDAGLGVRLLGAWFDADPGARFALSREGQVLETNPAAQMMLTGGLLGIRSDRRLQFGTSHSESMFAEAVVACSRSSQPKRLILRLKDGEWASAELRDAADGELLVLAFHRITGHQTGEGMDALASAFHLTSAETGILQDLCNGECPKSVARRHGTSEHTVRAHLRAIYMKMGSRGLTNTVAMAVLLIA